MTRHRSLTTIMAIAMFGAAPALAGAPETPGEKGQLVQKERLYAQRSSKNGWGQIVAEVARGDNRYEDRKLGEYLDDNTAGPAKGRE